MSSSSSRSSGLGSLTQAARQKQLNQARNILLAIGLLNIVICGILMALVPTLAKSQVEKEIKDIGPGMVADPAKVKEAEETYRRSLYLVVGASLALGVFFFICGLIIKLYPVPVTILSLVVYIGQAAVVAAIDPSSLLSGWLWKIIIVVCLIRALQSALAYEKERRASLEVDPVE